MEVEKNVDGVHNLIMKNQNVTYRKIQQILKISMTLINNILLQEFMEKNRFLIGFPIC